MVRALSIERAGVIWYVHGVLPESEWFFLKKQMHALFPFSGMNCIAVASLVWLGSAPFRV